MKHLFLLGVLGLICAAPVTAGEIETSQDNLKQAVEIKDAAMVKKYAAEASALVRKILATPAPAGAEAKAEWAKQAQQAKELALYSEKALYTVATSAGDEALIDLVGALEKQNPKSQYLDAAYGPYLRALQEAGARDKAVAAAEKAVVNFPENEDVLGVLCDNAMAKRQSAKASVYAEKLLVIVNKHPKPEGVSDDDWAYKKNSLLGRAYYTAGMVHSERQQFVAADQDLRAAVPLIKDDQALAAIYYHLGVANYNLGMSNGNKARVMDAVKFSEQSAAIESPFKTPATANMNRMRAEAARLR